MEEGIYIPREHFEALLVEIDTAIGLVDKASRVLADISRCRVALLAARRRVKENDPDITPLRYPDKLPRW